MNDSYFNFSTHVAESWWERWIFMRKWWQIYASDQRWTPPFYPRLRRLLVSGNSWAGAQIDRTYLHLEAFPRRRSSTGVGTALFEEVVAAGVVTIDRRRPQPAAYLQLFHCVNDEDVLDQFLAKVMEHLWSQGIYHFVGPLGPSPFLQSGVLHNYFHVTPPLYTAYNPPYLPEFMESSLTPWQHLQLFQQPISLTVAIAPVKQIIPDRNITLSPLAVSRLAEDLLPLWQIACRALGDFLAPDQNDTCFMLQWLQEWPLWGWLATVADEPVGFVLLQPDLALALRRANGGRTYLWRWWLQWRSRRNVRAGRLPYEAVAPAWRGRGIGRLLWQQALWSAQQQGWQHLSVAGGDR
ncbi:MAG: GNAT family N-acetyltransferase [Caldilineaceae bacterium]